MENKYIKPSRTYSETYSDFAGVYDELMDNVPYEEWGNKLDALIRKYGISRPKCDGKEPLLAEHDQEVPLAEREREALLAERNLVVDLCCGTGTLTEIMYGKGYDMIGVDSSESMLNEAVKKKDASGSEILYLNQDVRELELYSTVGTVYSVCDSLNYILEEEELLTVFSLVNNYLFPGGIFIFDFNTDYKYRTVIGNATIAENRENCSFIWENYYDPEEKLNEYDLTVFVRQEGELFRRFSEVHLQRGYTLEQMTALLEKAGMTLIDAVDAGTFGKVSAESERICVVAGEGGKAKGKSGM